jgi:flagellin-like hook-associated protein FlgL
MMISNVLRDLNSGMGRVSKYSSQLASNRKMVNLSDNPIGLLNSLNARQNLRQITQYRSNITTTRKWAQQAETSVRDMNDVIIKIKENVVDAAGTKNPSDKNNIAKLITELRDHLIETCNTAVGDKYIFAGYNSTKKPFTYDKNGTLLYNGIDLADTAPKRALFQMSGIPEHKVGRVRISHRFIYYFRGGSCFAAGVVQFTSTSNPSHVVEIDLNDHVMTDGENTLDLSSKGLGIIKWDNANASTAAELASALDGVTLTSGLYETSVEPSVQRAFELGNLESLKWDGPITADGKYYLEADGDDLVVKDLNGDEVVRQTITTGGAAGESNDLTAFGLGTITWDNDGLTAASPDEIAKAIASGGYITSKLNEEMTQNVEL